MTLSGCGTLFNSKGGEVNFTSNPPGADVIVNGQTLGQTPVQLDLPQDETHQVTIKNANGQRDFFINREIGTTWLILDILGGLVPVVVDVITGKWYELSPNQVHAELN